MTIEEGEKVLDKENGKAYRIIDKNHSKDEVLAETYLFSGRSIYIKEETVSKERIEELT